MAFRNKQANMASRNKQVPVVFQPPGFLLGKQPKQRFEENHSIKMCQLVDTVLAFYKKYMKFKNGQGLRPPLKRKTTLSPVIMFFMLIIAFHIAEYT